MTANPMTANPASAVKSRAAAPGATQQTPAGAPMLALDRQHAKIGPEVLAAVERVCASQDYILGPEVEAFEHELAAFCGAAHAAGCTPVKDSRAS